MIYECELGAEDGNPTEGIFLQAEVEKKTRAKQRKFQRIQLILFTPLTLFNDF